MKKNLILCIMILLFLLVSCQNTQETLLPNTNTNTTPSSIPTTSEITQAPHTTVTTTPVTPSYRQITGKEAKEMMDTLEDYIILDVRTQQEYDMGYIPGAILIPVEVITEKAPTVLTNKNAIILVYCRSGNRSKTASQALAEMGYTNVYEFGGITTWEYEITR